MSELDRMRKALDEATRWHDEGWDTCDGYDEGENIICLRYWEKSPLGRLEYVGALRSPVPREFWGTSEGHE